MHLLASWSANTISLFIPGVEKGCGTATCRHWKFLRAAIITLVYNSIHFEVNGGYLVPLTRLILAQNLLYFRFDSLVFFNQVLFHFLCFEVKWLYFKIFIKVYLFNILAFANWFERVELLIEVLLWYSDISSWAGSSHTCRVIILISLLFLEHRHESSLILYRLHVQCRCITIIGLI